MEGRQSEGADADKAVEPKEGQRNPAAEEREPAQGHAGQEKVGRAVPSNEEDQVGKAEANKCQ